MTFTREEKELIVMALRAHVHTRPGASDAHVAIEIVKKIGWETPAEDVERIIHQLKEHEPS